MRGLGVLFVGCLLVLCAAPAFAQDTTGRMMVRTSDAGTSPLQGVTVTIASPSLIGGAQMSVTDERGEALFVTLNPGTYEVSAALHGFATQERTEVWVRLGSLTALNVTMPEATFEGEVIVFDETPVVDPQQIGTEQIFDADYIEKTAIGTWGRFIMSPGRQAPGVTNGQDFLGSQGWENAWFLDGIEITNSNYGGPPAVGYVGIDAYQEFEVKTGGFEAEYGRAMGGVTSVVMKSGGNAFSGSVDARYQADAFQEGGEHFDPDLQDNTTFTIDATLGGPIIRDRLWFFASFFHARSSRTPEGSPTSTKPAIRSPKAKLTWQIAPSWRGTASYFGNRHTNDNVNASRWTMPEATAFADYGRDYVSLGADGMLSDELLLNLRAGFSRSTDELGPMSGDLATISHQNVTTGINSRNFIAQDSYDEDRLQLASDLSWFVSGAGGSHEIKGGLEFTGTRSIYSQCFTGAAGGVRCDADVTSYAFIDLFADGREVPFIMLELDVAGPVTTEGRLWVAYLQDAWRPVPNLTVKAGLRVDSMRYDMERVGSSVTMERLQPRLGVAWDILGNARNVVRVSAGRFMDPATMSLPRAGAEESAMNSWTSCSVAAAGGGFDPSMCSSVAGQMGWLYRTDDPDGWDPYGWTLDPNTDIHDAMTEIDPGLESAYSDQLILSYERALWPRSSVELSLIHKKTHSLFEDTCDANIPEPTEVPACETFVVANLPQLEREYNAFIARIESRTLDWLTVLASYTLSDSKGNHESRGFSSDWNYYPWHWENRYGYLANHYRHDIKVNGYVLLPYDFTIAFAATWRSAFRWTPMLDEYDNEEMPSGVSFAEPRGNREGADFASLDLQFFKGFRIGPTRLDLIVSVLNVLSQEEVTEVCEFVTGCGDFELGDPIDWERPRRWEVGVRLTF